MCEPRCAVMVDRYRLRSDWHHRDAIFGDRRTVPRLLRRKKPPQSPSLLRYGKRTSNCNSHESFPSILDGLNYIYQRADQTPYGALYKVVPETTETTMNEMKCFGANGTSDEPMTSIQSVLPATDNFTVRRSEVALVIETTDHCIYV